MGLREDFKKDLIKYMRYSESENSYFKKFMNKLFSKGESKILNNFIFFKLDRLDYLANYYYNEIKNDKSEKISDEIIVDWQNKFIQFIYDIRNLENNRYDPKNSLDFCLYDFYELINKIYVLCFNFNKFCNDIFSKKNFCNDDLDENINKFIKLLEEILNCFKEMLNLFKRGLFGKNLYIVTRSLKNFNSYFRKDYDEKMILFFYKKFIIEEKYKDIGNYYFKLKRILELYKKEEKDNKIFVFLYSVLIHFNSQNYVLQNFLAEIFNFKKKDILINENFIASLEKYYLGLLNENKNENEEKEIQDDLEIKENSKDELEEERDKKKGFSFKTFLKKDLKIFRGEKKFKRKNKNKEVKEDFDETLKEENLKEENIQKNEKEIIKEKRFKTLRDVNNVFLDKNFISNIKIDDLNEICDFLHNFDYKEENKQNVNKVLNKIYFMNDYNVFPEIILKLLLISWKRFYSIEIGIKKNKINNKTKLKNLNEINRVISNKRFVSDVKNDVLLNIYTYLDSIDCKDESVVVFLRAVNENLLKVLFSNSNREKTLRYIQSVWKRFYDREKEGS